MRDTGAEASAPAMAPARLQNGLGQLLGSIYPQHDRALLAEQALAAFFGQDGRPRRRGRVPANSLWSEKDNYVITYGNTLVDGEHKPLDLLHDFSERYLAGVFTGIHILPFFPFTSDDGFAVTDYREVNSQLGDWADISRIAGHFRLMSDLVMNHCSSQSRMFSDFLQGHEPWDRFFKVANPDDDLSAVVRPRTHPLLRAFETESGIKHVWCTFSHDQVDFDFSNPRVLFEFLDIIREHIERGVRTIRLDAVAFLWKEIGTRCIHLRQTHEIIRLIRLLCDYREEPIVLITETNVPNVENLSYFGNRNEAHMIYNFALPPLLLHALLGGTSKYLNAWQMAMPPAQLGCAYFNFSASHDGIGLRPAEGLISEEEILQVIDTVQGFGGRVSYYARPDGDRPYELNVALFDAFAGTHEGTDDLQVERFLCSQAIVMGLEGIPAFYIHSLLATRNDYDGVEKLGYNRAINRKRLDYAMLRKELDDPNTLSARVLSRLKEMVRVRSAQPAFHPNATQFTLQLGEAFFGFWRQSLDRAQSIFAVSNLTAEPRSIPSMALNLIEGDAWCDLLSGEPVAQLSGEIAFAPYQTRWISNRQTVS
ncbi:sugar phosphorylase [Nitratireductor sp. L1-7-SE]|uniref:Sugar phosphorylase n=1 Tax=Nitratireductor rhodophyticola TaxID=2854036 RepID=A0ABS7RAC2_9HYPH|nr:sugar phosphorylase [Nitratireductor rhodophyticola]MBY8917863.1 sugar phosphorylase [Nitratireductor rhodophyticola]MBY8922574.1 sugar phosphorylase [Nitratireductor rhodophyticola]